MVRILLADNHPIARRGIRNLISETPNIQICGEAGNGRDAVKSAIKLEPDIVIVELNLPELNGIEVTRQIKKSLPKTEILIYTMHEIENQMCKALSAGARGFILKSDDEAKLLEAIGCLSNHKPFLNSKASETLLESFIKRGSDIKDDSILTDREREILQLLAEGKSNKDIASSLGISVRTVEAHRATIMGRLDIHTIVELVHYAIRNNIVEE